MTPQDARTLVDYNYWATHRVLDAVAALTAEQFTRDLASSFRSVRDTLSHLHGSEWIWLSRLHGESPRTALPHDRFPDLASARAAWAETEAGVRAWVDGADQEALDRVIEYRFLSGQATASRIVHILQHVVNHGTYHRGQLTTMLRQLDAAPPASLDLIAYYRQQAG